MQSLGLMGLVFDTGLSVTPPMGHLGCLACAWNVLVENCPNFHLYYNSKHSCMLDTHLGQMYGNPSSERSQDTYETFYNKRPFVWSKTNGLMKD